MKPHRILFVCLGNICRSSSAEGVMNHLVSEAGLEDQFVIDSAGILSYHRGELPDSRMRAHAIRRGYELTHRSRPVQTEDFYNFDLIIGMDDRNIEDLKDRAPSPEEWKKIHRMTEFCTRFTHADHVPDPYYGGAEGFEYVLDLLEDACAGLLVSAWCLDRISCLHSGCMLHPLLHFVVLRQYHSRFGAIPFLYNRGDSDSLYPISP